MSNSEYDKLRKIWYKKLSKVKDENYPDGFSDIEFEDETLRIWSTPFQRKKSIISGAAKETYYRHCRYFLNDHKFSTRREEIIWAYHSEGISVRDIVKLLKKVRIKMARTQVWEVINKLEKIMKKMYLPGYK